MIIEWDWLKHQEGDLDIITYDAVNTVLEIADCL